MHGRLKVKTTEEQEQERNIKEREKAYHFKHLSEKLFALRASIDDGQDLTECFKLSSELLMINPDFYTVWNIRREAILKLIEQDEETSEQILKEELRFTIDCLKKNEKSYSVWQHRIWCLSKMPQSEYQNELQLCNTFLIKDERNFHCWDYRSYISDVAQADLESEFKFTTEKIHSNFSNFSAWHRRHKLILRAMSLPDCPKSCDLNVIWNEEYKMVLEALFTDPSDQSPWLYHNWLVKNHQGRFKQEHLDTLKELQTMEPDNQRIEQALDVVKRFTSLA